MNYLQWSAHSKKRIASPFSGKIYKVAISFGLNTSGMHPINFVCNNSARRSFLQKDIFEPYWLPSIRSCHNPRLRHVTSQKVEVVAAIFLDVRTGDSVLRVMSGIVRNLTVPVLLGTSFIDRFIKVIFASERKIVPFNPPPVLIVMVHGVESDKIEERRDGTAANITAQQDFNQNLIQLTRTITLKLLSETSVFVARNAMGIISIDSYTQVKQKYPRKVVMACVTCSRESFFMS